MRVTIKLDTFDSDSDAASTELCLDWNSDRWSLDGLNRIELPSWGIWRHTAGGTLLLGPDDRTSFFLLPGVKLGTPKETSNPCEPGTAQDERAGSPEPDMYGDARTQGIGHWHVQCVEWTSTVTGHEASADEADVSWANGVNTIHAN